MSNNPTPYDAAKYEEGIRRTVPFNDAFYSETIDLVRYIKPSVNVWLDTGCGIGTMVARAFKSFPTTRFLLADPSCEMLEKAKEVLKNIPADHLEVVGAVGSEALTDVVSVQPQVITSILAHHYLSREGRSVATRNCYELLENGGVYVTFENICPLTEDGKDIGLGRWKAYQQMQGKTENEASEHIARFNASYFPITIDEHLRLFKTTGFEMAELFWFSNMQAGLYAVK